MGSVSDVAILNGHIVSGVTNNESGVYNGTGFGYGVYGSSAISILVLKMLTLSMAACIMAFGSFGAGFAGRLVYGLVYWRCRCFCKRCFPLHSLSMWVCGDQWHHRLRLLWFGQRPWSCGFGHSQLRWLQHSAQMVCMAMKWIIVLATLLPQDIPGFLPMRRKIVMEITAAAKAAAVE